MNLAQKLRLENKYIITGSIVFETAFRIGSGNEGDSGSDLGVLLDSNGSPLLPGSTLKGKFRSTVEKLSYIIGLEACCLDYEVSGINCVSDIRYFTKHSATLKNMSSLDRYRWLMGSDTKEKHICDVCKLFGSPMTASRVFFRDTALEHDDINVIERRDGVVIDRDSERAVEKMKYDYEVVPANTTFQIQIDLENLTMKEKQLVAIGISEWEEGVRLGGGTSRGLGAAKLCNVKRKGVENKEQLFEYLTRKQITEITTSWLHPTEISK